MLEHTHEDLADLIAARVEDRLRQRGSAVVPELLTPPEAAIFLNSPIRTLENWRARGGGPAFIRVGTKTVRYHVDDLRAWIHDRRVDAGVEQ